MSLASPIALAAGVPSVDTPYPTGQHAPADGGVVIGIETYLRPGVPGVPYARRDAEAFSDFLISTRGVPTDRVQLIEENANATKIRSAAKALGQSVGAGGIAWVYFAGHGGASLDGGGRMLLGDDVSQDPVSFDSSGVLVAEIEQLAGAGGGRVVILVDACYTGTGRDGQAFLTGHRTVVPGGYTALRPAANVVWTAASAGQTSGPLDDAQHGAFTYFALGALRGWADGAIDGVRDGNVTMDEAGVYVGRSLKTAQITSQTPEIVGARDLVLSVKAKEAAPVIVVNRAPGIAPAVGPRIGDAIVDAGTNFQAQLEAARQAAAAEAEKQFIATEAAKQRAATLDAAEATLRKQATADWASARSLVDGGGAGAKAAADAFIAAYGSAKVRVDSDERAVEIAEVATARSVSASAAAQVQAQANPRVAALALAAPAPVSAAVSPSTSGAPDFASPTLGTMKWIPAGTFTMGSPFMEDAKEHQVTLTNGYWLMEHEVTQEEYRAVMRKNPSRFKECGENCPVERVSWDDAVAFAKAASSRDGVTYRLPTEAEWERAARGEQSALYAGSDELGAVAWNWENSGSTTHAVCGLQRNGYGLCDMLGNVREWVSDWSGEYSGAVTDPVGDSSGTNRVDRGGDWYPGAVQPSVDWRYYDEPDHADNCIGFRLARPSP